jgi:hypothetical protein
VDDAVLERVMYSSHESSLAVGGQWLVGEIKKRWPEWPQHTYNGWDYERPPGGAGAGGIA